MSDLETPHIPQKDMLPWLVPVDEEELARRREESRAWSRPLPAVAAILGVVLVGGYSALHLIGRDHPQPATVTAALPAPLPAHVPARKILPAPPAPAQRTAAVTAPVAAPAAVNAAAAVTAAPAVKPSGPVVQLGAYPTMVVVDQKWAVLTARFADLAKLYRSVEPVSTAGGTLYRLRITGRAAPALCTRMQAAGFACYVASY